MRRLVGPLAFLVTLSVPAIAAATQPITISGKYSLDGEMPTSELIVESGGILEVKHFGVADVGNPSVVGKGVLHVRATRIWVKSGGTITADEAGHQGADSADGAGPGGGFMPLTGVFGPGGGAGYGGPGGTGTDGTCTVNAMFGLGGKTYGDMAPNGAVPPIGSAGGAARVSTGDGSLSRGGHGGGAIFLEAGTIQIDGAVTANGGAGSYADKKGGGGGSGGAVYLRTNVLTIGSGGSVSVRGGDGGDNAQAPGTTDNGGGGGGGRIFIEAPMPTDLTPFVVTGGASGIGCTTGQGVGGDGVVTTLMMPPCLDLDGDSHVALGACDGGDDCDDTDPAINPDAKEICDGVDNNCSATATNDGIDSNDPALVPCDGGLSCIDGQCRESGADAGPAKPNAAPPDYVSYRGGCGFVDVSALGAVAEAAALVALGLFVARVRRRRR